MNYGHISPGLLRQLTVIKGEVAQARTEWLGSLSDGQLANVIGPRFAEYFETLSPEVQWRMTWDKAAAAEVLEDYRAWAEEREV